MPIATRPPPRSRISPATEYRRAALLAIVRLFPRRTPMHRCLTRTSRGCLAAILLLGCPLSAGAQPAGTTAKTATVPTAPATAARLVVPDVHYRERTLANGLQVLS